ncbi:DUF5615 family PIN-like protein [Luteolibacter yonseiensis]|uniref:DUF5615 family PIN-like protein n=1 Tax=Luteolibacter yonseiensis TaxID=1144680 RepID=A0A934R3B4_9BACT|nr:DUF5615 family PIN-like protein [Luteolibacter yonseiensis]MBK1816057.1 DUF5615 family PIN-like protein [Luteolibacter yonseiensis]
MKTSGRHFITQPFICPIKSFLSQAMRWLLDQGLPRTAAGLLREKGEDATHVGEISMFHSKDIDILLHAARENQIVVTLDSDFHALLAVSNASQPSVIRLREEGLRGQKVCELILRLRDKFDDQLSKGCVLTVTTNQVRLRLLPINS